MPRSTAADESWRWELHPGSEWGAEADAWQAVFLLLIWKQGDALGFIRHGDNVLIVHHEASRGVAAQVDVDEQVVVTGTKQTCEWDTDRLLEILQLSIHVFMN